MSYAFKIHWVVDSIGRKHQHFCDLKRERPEVEPEDLWQIFQPIVRDGMTMEHLGPDEFYILTTNNKAELFSESEGLFRANASADETIVEYNRLRAKFTKMVDRESKVEVIEGKIQGSLDFDPKQRPDLHRILLEMSQLVESLDKYLTEAYSKAISISDMANELMNENKISIKFESPAVL